MNTFPPLGLKTRVKDKLVLLLADSPFDRCYSEFVELLRVQICPPTVGL